ncbi:cathepsin F-like [Haematobia irritans]|uniref:cathepsin F-like n=1 Tax=Haematobia irritans TaxID=7368 RepID=UPI003F4F4DD3
MDSVNLLCKLLHPKQLLNGFSNKLNSATKQLVKNATRSLEYAEKKTHKEQNHHSLNKVEYLKIDLNANERGSAKYGITEFADLTSSEYKQRTGIIRLERKGQCGSGWAFSVTGNVEDLHDVRTDKLEQYSEQELLDCDTTDSVCNGGLPDNAYDAIEKIGGLGLELEMNFPIMHAKNNAASIHRKSMLK